MNKTEKRKIFEAPTPIAHSKMHEYICTAITFVALPIVNCLIICAGKQSALYNSISRLAWPEGLLWLVYIWGILNIACFAYATHLALFAGGYTKRWRKIILTLEIVAAFLMTAGVSIPSYPYEEFKYLAMRTFHTAISSVGFFGFFIVLLVLSITMFKRNKRQAILSLAFNAFILIVGLFFLIKVTDPTSYCHVSAPSQMLIFDLFCVQALVNYYGMTIMPNEVVEMEAETTEARAEEDKNLQVK